MIKSGIKYRFLCFIVLALMVCQSLTGQRIVQIQSAWDDSFKEWNLIPEDESLYDGSLQIKWPLNNDWTEWEFEIGDISGNIRQKWANDPSQWEIISSEGVITARTVWPGNMSEWKVSDGRRNVVLKTKWGNIADEWMLKREKYGYFFMYTDWEGDPRDWVIEDDLDPEITTTFKMALMFLAIYHSTPKQ